MGLFGSASSGRPKPSPDAHPLLDVRKSSFDDDDQLSSPNRLSFTSTRSEFELEDGPSPTSLRSKRKLSLNRHFGLVRSTALVVGLVVVSLGLFVLYWGTKFFLLRHDAYAHSVFARPLIPRAEPVEQLVEPFRLNQRSTSQSISKQIQLELDSRLKEKLSLPVPTLACAWTAEDERTYASLRESGPYLFALNLYNNEQVLPTLSRTLLDLADFLGPSKTHVSIFENGSTDNSTMAMAHLAAAFTARGVGHSILSDKRKTDWSKVDRIAQLSVYRNLALSPVNATAPNGESFTDVVFINDVYVCPRDALELLHQRRFQQADAACAVDWRATKSWLSWLGFRSVKMYDNWVARSITGDMLRNRFDMASETRDGVQEVFDSPGQEASRKRWLAAQAVPVYSCWNGMIALPAQPFQQSIADLPPTEFRSALNSPGECAASECKTIARDFWARGLNRWILVPSVHVTYAEEVYSHPTLKALSDQATLPPPADVPRLIDWRKITEPASVVCYGWVRGFHVDLPWRRTREKPFR